jgi:hypothetical protein
VKRALSRVALTLLAALILAGIASAATAGPVVKITSPKSGSSVSLRRTPYLAIAGTASFAATTPQTTTFYLHRDGCGTSADNPHMSTANGTDAGDGCGLVINGVVGLGGDADQATFIDFPATDGTPLALDGTRAITGVVALTGGQIGLAEVDVDASALVGGQAVELGNTTATVLMDDPTADNTPVPFTIPSNSALDGSDIQALDLRVHVHGPNIYSGFMALSGASYVKVPSYAASVHKSVTVAIDSGTPVEARLDGGTWSIAFPTPTTIGRHYIRAQATQGYSSSDTTISTFNVTK